MQRVTSFCSPAWRPCRERWKVRLSIQRTETQGRAGHIFPSECVTFHHKGKLNCNYTEMNCWTFKTILLTSSSGTDKSAVGDTNYIKEFSYNQPSKNFLFSSPFVFSLIFALHDRSSRINRSAKHVSSSSFDHVVSPSCLVSPNDDQSVQGEELGIGFFL